MEVREALEDDAPALANLANLSEPAVLDLIHDRAVRVAEVDGAIAGFVSFDARPETVYVTQLRGEGAALVKLLGEPVRFADREGMVVEVIVAADDDEQREAAETAGFEAAGAGPRFAGDETVRYRLPPRD